MRAEQATEFDAVASDYERQHAKSIRMSGENTDFFAEYKVQDVHDILTREDENPRTILDFGAGIGNTAGVFSRMFPAAHLICADVSKRSLELCADRYGDKVTILPILGGKLALADASVDVAFAACVFHHIEPEQHIAALAELRRVLRPGGSLFLFEHNPWNPLTRHAVANCPFDANAILITAPEMTRRLKQAGFGSARTRYRIFFPKPLAILRVFEPLLAWFPAGAQYSLHSRV